MPKTIEVNTDAGKVIVKKLPLNDYGKLLKALQKLPEQFGDFINDNSADDLKNPAKIIDKLPSIIATAIPEWCAFISIVDDKSPDFHGEELSLLGNVQILMAALEVNDYQEIMDNIKKLMPPAKQPEPEEAKPVSPATPSSPST